MHMEVVYKVSIPYWDNLYEKVEYHELFFRDVPTVEKIISTVTDFLEDSDFWHSLLESLNRTEWNGKMFTPRHTVLTIGMVPFQDKGKRSIDISAIPLL